jgi:hypothetical protein
VVLSVCGTAVAAVRFGSRTTESGRGDLGCTRGRETAFVDFRSGRGSCPYIRERRLTRGTSRRVLEADDPFPLPPGRAAPPDSLAKRASRRQPTAPRAPVRSPTERQSRCQAGHRSLQVCVSDRVFIGRAPRFAVAADLRPPVVGSHFLGGCFGGRCVVPELGEFVDGLVEAREPCVQPRHLHRGLVANVLVLAEGRV